MIPRAKIEVIWLDLAKRKAGSKPLPLFITAKGNLVLGRGMDDPSISLFSTLVGTYDHRALLGDMIEDVREAERQIQQGRSSDDRTLAESGMLG